MVQSQPTQTLEQITLFDYTALDTETRISLKQRAGRINERTRRIAQDIWENGREFHEAQQELAQYGYGRFIAWAETETGYSKRTVYNMIGVYQHIDCANFAQSKIAISALYLLAAPSTPESARLEALERAEQGEVITPRIAQGVISEHKAYIAVLDEEDAYTPYDELRQTDAPEEDWIPDEHEVFIDPVADEAEEIATERRSLVVHFSSKSDKHNTPLDIIERVIAVLGRIDLDPCSDSAHDDSPNVPALAHHTEADDGLAQSWYGRVYMNPPYGRIIGAWTEHLLNEYQNGNIKSALALVPARTDTDWFAPFFNHPICFVHGRLMFGDAENSAPFPSAVIYLGNDIDVFTDFFSELGPIVELRTAKKP
jgi:hypothetical protein